VQRFAQRVVGGDVRRVLGDDGLERSDGCLGPPQFAPDDTRVVSGGRELRRQRQRATIGIVRGAALSADLQRNPAVVVRVGVGRLQ